MTKTTDIRVDLNGLGEDTSLQDLADQLDAVDGVRASVNATRGLSLSVDSETLEFSFAEDSSGVLAALGLHTFFSGSSTAEIGVREIVAEDPSKFAASRHGIGEDSENAIALAGLANEPLESTGNLSITGYYERFTGELFQASAVTRGINEGFQTFHASIEGQHLGLSAVNIDEQAVKMVQQQRIFQASSRLVAAANELLETLVNL